MTKRIFMGIGVFLLAVYFCFAAFALPEMVPPLKCSHVRYVVNAPKASKVIEEKDLAKEIVAIERNPIGTTATSFDCYKVEKELIRRNALMGTSNLYFSPDGPLHVIVTQRKPLMLLLSSEGQYYITAKREAIPVGAKRSQTLPMIVLYGKVSVADAVGPLYDIAKQITADTTLSRVITALHIDEKGNLEATGSTHGMRLFFGKERSLFPQQCDALKLFMARSLPTIGEARIYRLYLHIPNQVIVAPFEPIIMDKSEVMQQQAG